jgi:hypothetical protein
MTTGSRATMGMDAGGADALDEEEEEEPGP